jgi:hypothetical protein
LRSFCAQYRRSWLTLQITLGKLLAVWRELGSQQRIAISLCHLGRIARRTSDFKRSDELCRESLKLCIGQPDKILISYVIGHFACLQAEKGEFKSAVCLFGAAYARFEAMGARIQPLVQNEFDQHLEMARQALGEEAFAAAYAEGRMMTLDQAILLGLGRM